MSMLVDRVNLLFVFLLKVTEVVLGEDLFATSLVLLLAFFASSFLI